MRINLIYQLSSPQFFYQFAGKVIPWLSTIATILFLSGLIGGLILAPADYQQGDGFRIIYIHVPSAFLSMAIYVAMAVAAIISLIWRIKLADVFISASAPLGAWFTVLALVTGSIWGKPMWGTWWVWDARLTSELILLFLYMGFIALQSSFPERTKAARAGAIVILVGVVNIPIIHYSVVWWNTLHQGASLSLLSKPTIAESMLYPLIIMIFAFGFYYFTVVLMRMRSEILIRENKSGWVMKLINTPFIPSPRRGEGAEGG